jgi:tetratricopeptide (TPR) repeat protein
MNGRFLLIPVLILSLIVGCTNDAEVDVLAEPPYARLTDSIKKFPSNADLLLRRGELLAQNDKHELANLDFKSAWEKEQSEHVAMAYVSNLFLVNKPRQAVKLLEESVKKFPDNPEFRRRLSEAYIQIGSADKAMMQYDSILNINPANFEAWYEKGMLLTELKDTAGALAAFEQSYHLQPLTLNGVPLANLYAETKNPKAIEICDELIRKDSAGESLDPVYIKGIYYSNTRQHKLAIEQFEQCIRKDWKFTDAYIEKGIILYEIKNIDEALQTFKLASTISPRYPDTYYWQGRCYEAIGKKEEAMENYIRAYSLDRNFVEARERIENLRKKS